ncbi:Polyadenylate-binding protein RBP47B' [Platanthera guangdongensis]|uniref:Polyadenylate-binding protein RBP47B n=1 Tax=Platanthera guangdongensis TaxID=2320717 RepID=A0ABR2MYA6_9ASPA
MARKRKLSSQVIAEEEEEEDQPTGYSSEEEDDGEAEDGDEEADEEGDEEEDDEEDDDDDDEEEDEELDGDDDENNQAEVNEEDLSSKESIIKLLQPFAKDQLIEILKDAVRTNPSLLSRVLNVAETDPIHRNIFVHGLGFEVTSETLLAVFSPFGKIAECKVVTDHTTGRCKGFGFVLFRLRSAAQRALKEPLKKIGNRMVSCQLASLGAPGNSKELGQQAVSEVTGRKIYVNNVGVNINPERLLDFFSKFGEIEQGPLGCDPATGKFRGYALFYYKTVEGCNKALEEPTKHFEGCELRCQRAFEGPSKKHATQMAPMVATNTVPGGAQKNDLALSYASAVALMGQNLGQGATIGQSGRVGLLNPAAGLSPALSGVAGIPSMPYAVGSANRASGLGVNSISPSVIGSYGSLAALQGLGAYQPTPTEISRSRSGIGSIGASGLQPF